MCGPTRSLGTGERLEDTNGRRTGDRFEPESGPNRRGLKRNEPGLRKIKLTGEVVLEPV